MRYDMISVFNMVTRAELSGSYIFDNILKGHNMKFKYFYSLLEDVKYKHIEDIYADIDNEDKLCITIIPVDIEYLNEIIFAINGSRESYPTFDDFVLDVWEIDSNIYISIGLNEKYNSESEMIEA